MVPTSQLVDENFTLNLLENSATGYVKIKKKKIVRNCLRKLGLWFKCNYLSTTYEPVLLVEKVKTAPPDQSSSTI